MTEKEYKEPKRFLIRDQHYYGCSNPAAVKARKQFIDNFENHLIDFARAYDVNDRVLSSMVNVPLWQERIQEWFSRNGILNFRYESYEIEGDTLYYIEVEEDELFTSFVLGYKNEEPD